MKIWRRGWIGTEYKNFLENNEIKHEPQFGTKNPTQLRNFMFEIAEDDPAWPELKVFLKGDHTFTRTLFTDKERFDAEWCKIRSDHSIKSIRVPSDYGWSEEFFQNQCNNCGSGWKQIASLKLKREPKLGKNQFSSFGSGFELFCTPLVLEEFSRQNVNGFETWPLLLENSGEPIESLKQIMVTEVAEPAIAEELVERECYSQTDCPVCGQTWHAHYIRGMLPLRRAALKPNVDFQLTNEWFGNGRTARREILVSQRVVRLILENKWKGAELIPIQSA
jgi:hypothetical protein